VRKTEREKSFMTNGATLLEDLIASSNGKCNPIRNFSAEELIRATNNFDSSRIIQICSLFKQNQIIVDELDDTDRVTYAMYKGSLDDRPIIVKKFTDFQDDRQIIVKKFTKFSSWESDKVRSFPIRDIVIATQMSNHKHVLKLLGCCLEFPIPALVYEYAANGALNDQGGFGDDELLPWKIRLRISKELANALTYLHTALRRPVIHRDIRPSSIFLDNNFVPKLCNFSVSITIPLHETHARDDLEDTFGHSDPDSLASGFVTEKSDVYGFGVLLLVFLTGKKDTSTLRLEGKYHSLIRYVEDHVRNEKVTDIVDPNILREGGGDGQAQQVEAFLALALACTQEKGEERPDMIDVAKELMRIDKSI